MGSALCLEYNPSRVFKWKVVNIKIQSRNWSLKHFPPDFPEHRFLTSSVLPSRVSVYSAAGFFNHFFLRWCKLLTGASLVFLLFQRQAVVLIFLLDSQKALSETFWQLCKDQIGRIDLTNGFIRLSKLVVLNFISNTSWNWKCLIAKASWYQGKPSGLKSWSEEPVARSSNVCIPLWNSISCFLFRLT